MRARALTTALVCALAAGSPAARAETTVEGALAAIGAAAPRCPPARAHCLPLRLHVAPAPAGAPGPLVVDAPWVAAQLAQASAHLAAIDAGVELAAVTVLPEAAAHLPTRAARSDLAAHARRGAIDVFVTGQLDNVDDPATPVRGVAWRAGGHKYVILAAAAPDRVLTHEIGHVLGLPHSTYAISLMNKTPRTDPPLEARTFAPEEVARMRTVLARLLRARVIVPVARAPAAE